MTSPATTLAPRDAMAPGGVRATRDAAHQPAPASGDGHRGGRGDAPHLTLVPQRPSTATYWRRRILVLAGMLIVGLLVVGAVGQVGASADLADRVDGHVVIEPGQTLWDIAVTTAPTGVDARDHLAAIEELNGLRADDVRAWNVILLPAR